MKKKLLTPNFSNKKEYIKFIKHALVKRAELAGLNKIQLRFNSKINLKDRVEIGRDLRRICSRKKISLFTKNDAPFAFYLNADGVCCDKNYLKRLPGRVIRIIAKTLGKNRFRIETM